jgi:cysteinyl-tRNA synthetase
MSMKYLGESFDMHCGGEDLVFPHHEDEIAQSEAATGKPFVRYWLHCAHLMVNGQKMSKRSGNFYTLRDLLAKGFTGRELRYALLGEHYRRPLNFTLEGVEAARASLARIDEMLVKLQETAGNTAPSAGDVAGIAKLAAGFEAGLDDDLNVSAALGVVFDFVRDTNKSLAARALKPGEAAAVLQAWQRLDTVLGLGMPQRADAPADIVALAEQRQAARKAKDFKRADQLRDELKAKGWVVEDTPRGPKLKQI